jgi:hypothetical protein
MQLKRRKKESKSWRPGAQTKMRRSARGRSGAKRHDQDRQFVREVADAFNFRLTGIESPDGRATYVIDADPPPGYRPHLKEVRFLPKFRFRVWIDKGELEWRKLDIQCIGTVSFGLCWHACTKARAWWLSKCGCMTKYGRRNTCRSSRAGWRIVLI